MIRHGRGRSGTPTLGFMPTRSQVIFRSVVVMLVVLAVVGSVVAVLVDALMSG